MNQELRELCRAYAVGRLRFEDYRQLRVALLHRITLPTEIIAVPEETTVLIDQEDRTVPMGSLMGRAEEG